METKAFAGLGRAPPPHAVEGQRDGTMKSLKDAQRTAGVTSSLVLRAAEAYKKGRAGRPKKKKEKREKAFNALRIIFGGKKAKKKKKKKKGSDQESGVGDSGGSGDPSGSDGSGSNSDEKESSEEASLLPPLKKRSDRQEGSVLELLVEQVEARLNELSGAGGNVNPLMQGTDRDLLALPHPRRGSEPANERRPRDVLDSKLCRPSPSWTPWQARGRARGSLVRPRASTIGPKLVRCKALRTVFPRTPHSGRTGDYAGGQEVLQADGQGCSSGRPQASPLGKGAVGQKRLWLATGRALAGEGRQRKRRKAPERRQVGQVEQARPGGLEETALAEQLEEDSTAGLQGKADATKEKEATA